MKIHESRIKQMLSVMNMYHIDLLQKGCESDVKSSAFWYTGTELSVRERVLGGVEKNSFIALPGKRVHSRLLPQKTPCVPTREDMTGSYIATVQGRGC